MGVAGRVYGRLHWDKDLEGAKIDLDVKENGVATLAGTVPDVRAQGQGPDPDPGHRGRRPRRRSDLTISVRRRRPDPGTVTTTKETQGGNEDQA